MLLESTHGTVKFLVKYLQCVSNGGYGTPNRILMLLFWYQKMCEFLISENATIFWYQKLFSDIRNYFLISENATIFWYQKLFSDIRKSIRNYFLISENNFWYQKIVAFSDIRKSKFPLVFAKINRYFMMFVVLESKLGHGPVVTSSQENVVKCTAPEYSCKPCKLHKVETCHLKFKIHLCRLLVWKIVSGKRRNNVTSLWNVYTCSDVVFTSCFYSKLDWFSDIRI